MTLLEFSEIENGDSIDCHMRDENGVGFISQADVELGQKIDLQVGRAYTLVRVLSDLQCHTPFHTTTPEREQLLKPHQRWLNYLRQNVSNYCHKFDCRL